MISILVSSYLTKPTVHSDVDKINKLNNRGGITNEYACGYTCMYMLQGCKRGANKRKIVQMRWNGR